MADLWLLMAYDDNCHSDRADGAEVADENPWLEDIEVEGEEDCTRQKKGGWIHDANHS